MKSLMFSFLMRRALIITCVGIMLSYTVYAALAQTTSLVRCIKWNADSTKIAIGYENGVIEVKELKAGTSSFLRSPGSAIINSLSWNPSNPSVLAVSYDAPSFDLFDASTGQLLRYIMTEAENIPAVDWNQDGTKLAAAYAYKPFPHSPNIYTPYIVSIWDPANGTLLASLEGHGNSLTSVGWSNLPGDNRLVSAGQDKRIILWDGDTGVKLTEWSTDTPALQVVWAPDEPEIAVILEGEIQFWDLSTSNPVRLANLTYHAENLMGDFTWRSDSLAVAFVDGFKTRVYQLWPEVPYISNVISSSSNGLDWSFDNQIAFGNTAQDFHIVNAPFEDDPELKPSPTGSYEPPTETPVPPTPFGTPPPPTLTPFPFPTPDAGPDRTIETYRDTANVTFDASGTIDPANIVELYAWYIDEVATSVGKTTTILMSTGVHTVQLQVVYRYDDGTYRSMSDSAIITIVKVPTPTPTLTFIPTQTFTP